jgi:hypothetical protein
MSINTNFTFTGVEVLVFAQRLKEEHQKGHFAIHLNPRITYAFEIKIYPRNKLSQVLMALC